MKISIVTVCLNSQETIVSAVRSVCEQDYPDIEYVVIDGGSQDNTLTLIAPYQGKLATVVSEPDQGIYDAMNKGLALATGEVVGFLNADDMYADTDVVRRIAEQFCDPCVDACYGDLIYVDPRDPQRITRRWHAGIGSKAKLYQGWMPPHPTFFMRRQCYQQHGGYRLDMGTAADYELMLRYLLCHDIRAVYLHQVLVQMRSGGASNTSFKSRFSAHLMDWKAWWVNGLMPYPWTLLCKPLRKLGQWF